MIKAKSRTITHNNKQDTGKQSTGSFKFHLHLTDLHRSSIDTVPILISISKLIKQCYKNKS